MVLTLLAGGYGGAASRVGISEPDSLCLEIEILNVAGPWEPEGARRLRLDACDVAVSDRAFSGTGSTEIAGE